MADPPKVKILVHFVGKFIQILDTSESFSQQFTAISEKTEMSISVLLEYRQKLHNMHYIWQISVTCWSF